MEKEQFLQTMESLSDQMFLQIDGYQNQFGEISNYDLSFRAPYKQALAKSLVNILQYQPIDALEKQAQELIIESLNQSLTNPKEDTTYKHLVPGVKEHQGTGELYVFGMVINKTVLQPGVYKEVASKPLTLARQKLERDLPKSKYRQFKIDLKKVSFFN